MSRSTRTVRVAGLLAIALALPLGGAPASAADAIRTETGLGGFRINASGAPFQMLLDDPTLPLPRPPDAAIVEADPSYTATTLSTGPTARALAATVWPGALLGDGAAQITQGTAYPFKADATYPGGEPEIRTEPGMVASAKGLDVVATANTPVPEAPAGGPLTSGNFESRSGSAVVKDVGISTVVSEVTDLTVAGLFAVKSVRTTLTTRSDGKKASTEGTTVVSGLSVNGIGLVVDEKGVRPVADGKPGDPIVPALGDTPAELASAGIKVEPVKQTEKLAGTAATRTASGLRITLDTLSLREAITGTGLGEAFGAVCGAIPPEVAVPGAPALQGLCFYAASATPKITFVLAAGSTSSAANLPLTFALPPLAPPALPPALPPVGSPVSGSAPTAGDVLSAAPVLGADSGAASLGGADPLVSGESLVPLAAPREVPAGFTGIFGGLVLLALLAAGLGARGLLALRTLAFAGAAALGKGCLLGAPSSVPDLRGASA